MFEDISDGLKKGKKKFGKSARDEDDDEESTGDSKSGRRTSFDGGMMQRGNDEPSEGEIKRILEERFGGKVRAIRVPGERGIGFEMETEVERLNPRAVKGKMEGALKSMMYIAEQAKIPPTCVDAVGAEIKEGDIIKVPGGEQKTVLKVGWKFCILSRTDDQKKSDGPWYEDEMNEGNFIRKV